MEKKKNNAVEKAENAGKNKQGKTPSTKKAVSSDKKSSVNKAKERERQFAEKRIRKAKEKEELKKQKLQKKAERQKLKEQKNKRKQIEKEERKEKQERLKRQRLARKENMKTKKAAERSRKSQEKMELKEKKAEQKRLKKAEKSHGKRTRQTHKKHSKGFGGWLAATISLSVAVLALSTALALEFLMPKDSEIMMSTSYEQSFYDAVEQVENMELNMSKYAVTKQSEAKQKYLMDLVVNSSLAENDLQNLPFSDQERYYSVKLVNQVGDYAKYINNKLIENKEITTDDESTFNALYQGVKDLNNALMEASKEMGNDFDFSTLADKDKDNVLTDKFTELQNLSASYPEMIYDGPFSDGIKGKEVKALKDEEVITQEQAQKLFTEYFESYNLKDVKSVGETGGLFECFNYAAKTDGMTLYAQITKKGGKLLMFDYNNKCKAENYDVDQCVEIALNFLNDNGYQGMQEVWTSLQDGVATINFAYKKGDVIYYPDMIKVKVCPDTGKVVGLEASAYLMNHSEREFDGLVIGSVKAREGVLDSIDVGATRLTLIPTKSGGEVLCYEFLGEKDGATYYVYINAKNGLQEQLFKVVEGTEGTLLR